MSATLSSANAWTPALGRWLSALSLLWAGAVPAAAAGASTAVPPWTWLASMVYGIGHVVCHQRPERSFAWGSVAWPVCARCSGIYAGAALGALLALVVPLTLVASPSRVRLWVLGSAIPAALTLGYEWTTGQMPSNALRAMSGGVIGTMVAWLVVSFVSEGHGPGPVSTATCGPEVN